MGMTFYAGQANEAGAFTGRLLAGEAHELEASYMTAYKLTEELGYQVPRGGTFEAPIDEFIAKGEAWRRKVGTDWILSCKQHLEHWLARGESTFVSGMPPMIWVPMLDRLVQLAIDGRSAGATVMAGG